MTSFLHDVAGAAFPVAIALLALAVAARGVLWVAVDDERTQRVARLYLEPLSTWCLVAIAVHAFAAVAAGEASIGSMVVAILVGGAALALRPGLEVATSEAPVASPVAAEPHIPVPADGPLWAHRPCGEHPRGADGLWGR